MARFSRRAVLLLLWAALVPTGRSQPGPWTEAQVLDAARAIMKAAKYCFLITLDQAGQPQARLMEPFAPDADMVVWMGTNPRTRKLDQIRNNRRATLAYYDSRGPNYVTLIGNVRIVESLAEREGRWKTEWARFFPGGPGGSNYVLLEFTPSTIELISSTHKIASAPDSLRPASVHRQGSGWRLPPLPSSPAAQPLAGETVGARIRARRQEFVTAVNRGEFEKLLDLAGSELVLLTERSGGPVGPAMLRDMVKRMGAGGGLQLSMETARVEVAGELAYELGRFSRSIRSRDGATHQDRGRYLDTWKRQPDGEWRIILHAPLFDPAP